jgi:hypothetical protein
MLLDAIWSGLYQKTYSAASMLVKGLIGGAMKTSFRGQKKPSGVRLCKKGFLTAGLLAASLVAVVLMTAVRVAADDTKNDLAWQQVAQETGGFWLLIETIPDPIPENKKLEEVIHGGKVCRRDVRSMSEGSYVYKVEWNEACGTSRYQIFAAAATWSQPPERITPGTPLSLDADVNITENVPGSFTVFFGISISTDSPDVSCGYATEGEKTVCEQTVKSHAPEEKEKCVLEVGAGRSAGQQFALRYCVSGNSGYRYVYEWVPAETAPIDKEPEQPKPDPPKSDDSEPDTGYQGPSSSDPGSSSSGGSGSILGPLAVLGTLGTLGVLGVVGVVGAAAAAILVAVLKGGAAAGGASATAAGPAVGSAPDVAPDPSEDLLDDILDELDREIEEPAEPPQKEPVERKETEATIGEPSGDVDWTKYEIDHIRSKLRVELQAMKDEGRFIGNKTGFRKIWNLLPGQITNRIRGWNKNSYCGEMVKLGESHLNKILPDAHISNIEIERNGQMNHIANRVILQDGTEIIVDYWESLATGKPAIYKPEAWLKKWESELGKPLWGDYQKYERVGNEQINIIEHVLKNGEDAIDNFKNGDKSSEPIRKWWRSIDQHKRIEIQRDLFKTLSEGEKETRAKIIRYFNKQKNPNKV